MLKEIALLLVLSALTLYSSEGERLYTEAKCQRCHLKGSNFDPNSINKAGKSSKVKDMKSLMSWIVSCDNYFSIGWFPEEQKEVAEYLNRTYYKY